MSSVAKHRIWALLGVLLALALWELNARLMLHRVFAQDLPGGFFPSLDEIGRALGTALLQQSYWSAFVLTAFRTVAAFLVSGVLGVSVALVCARSSLLRALVHYPFEFLRYLPAVAVIPFAIIMFGLYSSMKIAVAFFGCFFPVFVGTKVGLDNVDHILILTARAYGWGGVRLLFGVLLPAALPNILAALRISLAIALILAVTSEMLVAADGLGGRLVELERAFKMPGLYAETFLLGLLGVGLNAIFRAAERRVHYWREDS